MKYCLTLAILAVAGTTYSHAEDVLPPQYNFDRYSKMVDQSPFAVASAVAAPAATPDFAKDLYIANAAKSQDGDLVTIKVPDESQNRSAPASTTTVVAPPSSAPLTASATPGAVWMSSSPSRRIRAVRSV